MASILDLALAGIVGMIASIIVANVYANTNKDVLSASEQSLLSLITLIVVAAVIVRVTVAGFTGA